jgi:hypothetical protein
MKKLLFSLLPAMFFSAFLIAQNPCNLINSVTLNAPTTNQITSTGYVLRLTSPRVSVDTSQWNYFAIVKDGSNGGKIYKNGQLVSTGAWGNFSYSWNRLDLGAEFFTYYSAWFNGWIDEVRISNRERTATEISNHFNSNTNFSSDANTIGLWHFDQSTGTTATSTVGPNGTIVNAQWNPGRFGNSLYYNGTNARTSMSLAIPTTNVTLEFWIKPNRLQDANPVSFYGLNTVTFIIDSLSSSPTYTWSTGQTGNSITVNPNNMPFVWVSNGSCRDTVFFNSQAATVYDTVTVTTYDTITTSIAVTDTLIINAVLSGLNPPNNTNTLQVYPNPARTHITIDNGNFALMNGCNVRINNTLGQTVFSQAVNQQQFFIDLSGWTGNGFYYLDLLDPQGNSIERKVIVVQ